ncbi:hypothetical protein BFO01nite_13120 [Brevibacillus formosus]|uniref:Uncharacterized protein n=1 Tax=Brevibacillus formosus TaxID=54913 RepID=A0ABQ0T255_9BACL|nr:hypothetical protein BFO01nite_13120 [Brevibacillus formosus]
MSDAASVREARVRIFFISPLSLKIMYKTICISISLLVKLLLLLAKNYLSSKFVKNRQN